jgi:iodotyrosine deiodinase
MERTAQPVIDGEDASYQPVPLGFRRLPVAESLERSRAFLETMRERRSVRMFSTDPVPYELIENAVAAAGTAPSGANCQPWTFAVVSDPDLKQRLRDAAEDEEHDFYAHHISDEWRAALAPLGTDFRKAHLTEAPYTVVVFGHAYGLEEMPDGTERRFKHYYMQESVGIAVGFFLASIMHAGLVALTHTPSPMAFLAEVLGRPRNERPYIVLPVGYPADNATVPKHALEKKPLDEILVRY